MSNAPERVAVTCPACSPDVETVHEVLKPGTPATVRCTDCDHVHKTTIETDEPVETNVVVSQGGESLSATTELDADETVAVGDEFVIETEEAIMVARVTDVELQDRRVEEAVAEEIETLWTRGIGNVEVNVTVHPKQGDDESRGVTITVPGDREFAVGSTEEFGDEEFAVEGIYLRENAAGYDFEKLDQPGTSVPAKDVKRLYARDETTTAWSAW